MGREAIRKKIFETKNEGLSLKEDIEANPEKYQKQDEGFIEVYENLLYAVEMIKNEQKSVEILKKLERENDVLDDIELIGVDNATEEEINKLFVWASVNEIFNLPAGVLPTEEQELEIMLELKVAEKWGRWKNQKIKHVGIGGVSEYSKKESKGPEAVYFNKEEQVENLNSRWEIAHKKFLEYLGNLPQKDRTLWEIAVMRGKAKTFGSKNNNDVITRRARGKLGGDYKDFIKTFEILRRLTEERQKLALELTSSEVSH